MSTRSESRFDATMSLERVWGTVERHWIGVWAALVFLFLYAPIIVLIVFSFERGTFSTLPWSGFTLEWYGRLFTNQQIIRSTMNSFYVGGIVTIVATSLGTLGAIALVRYDFRLAGVYRALVIAPMTLPGLLLGVALLIWFRYVGVSTTLMTVMIGQLVFVTPFVLITVSSRLRGFDPQLEEAARDLGATRWQTYRHVTLPFLMPGIVSGALFAFTLSFDDFLIAFFTSGVENTLPIYIWSKIQHGTNPVINAISTLVLLFSITLIIISERLGGRD
ncbi:ABC transporter permease [Halomarina halobia]|uniref:ABC transporter permease n=1 Tax=Halomarina halobia TaxID=3033386 RepID=A0ABD6ACV3_9EURY|nr:ABC transporter permease [Halomarina sp. PSR21]